MASHLSVEIVGQYIFDKFEILTLRLLGERGEGGVIYFRTICFLSFFQMEHLYVDQKKVRPAHALYKECMRAGPDTLS